MLRWILMVLGGLVMAGFAGSPFGDSGRQTPSGDGSVNGSGDDGDVRETEPKSVSSPEGSESAKPDTQDDSTPDQQRAQDEKTFSADYVKQLRDEAAQHRTLMQDMQKMVSMVMSALGGQQQQEAEQVTPEQLKTQKGQEIFAELQKQMGAFAQKLEATEQQAQQSQLEAQRFKIGAKYKLDDELTARIQGDTAEEMEADAKRLAKYRRGSGAAVGNSGEPSSQSDMSWHPLKQRGADVFGRGGVVSTDD